MSTPPDQRARAIRQYRAGATSREIAAILDVDPSTVQRWVEAAGVPLRPRGARPLADVADTTIRALRRKGRSWAYIAEEVGMSPTGVRRRYHASTDDQGRPRQTPR